MRLATRPELHKIHARLGAAGKATDQLCERLLATCEDDGEDPTTNEFADLRTLQSAITELQERFSHLWSERP